MTLGNSDRKEKQPTLDVVKFSLLAEEALRKYREFISNHKALVIEGDSNRGRGMHRGPHREKSRSRS